MPTLRLRLANLWILTLSAGYLTATLCTPGWGDRPGPAPARTTLTHVAVPAPAVIYRI